MNVEHRDTAWMILQALKEGGTQPRQELTGDDGHSKEALTNLMRAGYARLTVDGLVMLSPSGSRKLRQIREALEGPLPVAGKRTWVAPGHYDGKELKRTCLRDGAYDAYELPSLMDGKRYARREIKA